MADTSQRLLVDGEAGLHRDGAKPRLADMFPPELLLEAGRIWAQNNQPREGYPDGKYPDFPNGVSNYKGGIRLTKYLDSMMRHMLALIAGQDRDDDSGYDHAGHLLCNLAMFYWTRANRPDLDDRGAMPSGAQRTINAQPTWPEGAQGKVQVVVGPSTHWYQDRLGEIFYVRAIEGAVGTMYRAIEPDGTNMVPGLIDPCHAVIVEWGDTNATGG